MNAIPDPVAWLIEFKSGWRYVMLDEDVARKLAGDWDRLIPLVPQAECARCQALIDEGGA